MRGQPQQNGAKNLNLTVHCLVTLNKKGRLQPREGKDMKCCRKKRDTEKQGKKERKGEWELEGSDSRYCVWAIQGEFRLKCDSGLSCTIWLNTVVYGLDSDSSSQERFSRFLSLSHTPTHMHFSFIQLNIPWNHTTSSCQEEKSPAWLLLKVLK